MENQNVGQGQPQSPVFGQAPPPPPPQNPVPPAPAPPPVQPPVQVVPPPLPPAQSPVLEPAAAATPPPPAKPRFNFRFKPSRKAVIIAAVFAIVVLGASGGVYYWQQGKITEKQATIKTVSDGNTMLRLQLTKLQMAEKPALSSAAAIAPGTSPADELVLAAVRNNCSASVDPITKKPLILKVSTVSPGKSQVLYSADKNFAYVSAACNKDGTAAGSVGHYAKKVETNWVFLYRGPAPNPEYSKQFNIPAVFK